VDEADPHSQEGPAADRVDGLRGGEKDPARLGRLQGPSLVAGEGEAAGMNAVSAPARI